VSLHSLPPFDPSGPLPALGYLRGYLEAHRPAVRVTTAWWHQALPRLLRPWVGDRLLEGDSESGAEFWDALFTLLYLREAESPRNGEKNVESPIPAPRTSGQPAAAGFLEQYGSIFLDAQGRESFLATCAAVASFLEAEAQRLDLKSVDIVGASIMHRQLIPALAWLSHVRRRFPAALTVLGGFPTAHDARQILTAFPFVDIGVFGDGEKTLLEICDARQSGAAPDRLPGTVVRLGDEIVENPARGYVDASEMAAANYDGFDFSGPSDASFYLPICNARGCSWGRCAFCILNSRPPENYSSRPPKSILDELRHHLSRIRKTSDAPLQVYFLGNEIVGRRQGPPVLIELLQGLVQLNEEFGNLSIFGELSPLDMTDQVACLLNTLEATVQLGFEQWSRVVRLARKRHRIIDAVEALKLFERYPNLRIAGFNLIVGFPGETLLDVAETKSNLWRLKFLLALLAARSRTAYLRGGPLRVNVRPLRLMQVALPPPIVRCWDFQNPFVQENAAHRPWTVLLGMMGADQSLAADYVSRNQYFETYDTTATVGLQRRLVARLERMLEDCRMEIYRNSAGLLELALRDGRHRLLVPLENCLLRLLHETREIVNRALLAERLADLPADEIAEGIEFLDHAELLYLTPNGRQLLNTLPASIQSEVDRELLRQVGTTLDCGQHAVSRSLAHLTVAQLALPAKCPAIRTVRSDASGH
jgi:hypothetical protein